MDATRRDHYLPAAVRATIEEVYYAPINRLACLEALLQDASFLRNPVTHPGLFADHGVVHARDVTQQVLRRLARGGGPALDAAPPADRLDSGAIPPTQPGPQWLIDLCHLFVDQPNQVGGSEMTLFRLMTGYGVACLLGYSLVWLIETTPRRRWLFVVSLTLVPWGPLALVDLLRGGMLSTIERYLTPTYLGLELALAVVAAHKMAEQGRWARFWSVLVGLLLVWGLLGDVRLTQVRFVRTKGDNDALIAASEVINPLSRPLLMVNMWRTAPYTFLVMGRLFDDDTQLRLIYDHSLTLVPEPTDGEALYILNPSPVIRQRLAAAGEPVRDLDFADLIQVRP